MGFVDRLFGPSAVVAAALETVTLDAEPVHRFSATAIGSDYQTWTSLMAGTSPARVTRTEALSVPAVKRSRDLIASVLGSLPLHAMNAAGDRIDTPLLTQPESASGLVRSVTLSRTIADLLFESSSLWLVVLRNAQGFPAVVERVEWGCWTQDQTGEIRVNGRVVPNQNLILFTSPNDPLLTVGARAIRSLLQLEQTAALFADEPEPAVAWRAADGVDPEETDVVSFLGAWRAARKARATAFVPAAFERMESQRQTPEELQLISAREFMVTEIARLVGISSTWLNVNTTTRTYLTAVDERRQFTDFVLAPFISAVEQRLSLNDVVPRGQYVKFALDGWLRAATKERYESYAIALQSGWMSVAEVRNLEDLPALEAQQ